MDQRTVCPTRRARGLRRGVPRGLALAAVLVLSGCATVGSLMSPYSETYSCKNKDHGQCIHPERAYEDALAGINSKSDPAVTNDRKMLRAADASTAGTRGRGVPSAYGDYRDSVYQELKGLIDAPVTPMLKPARTVRTLILPYADRQRPDRLYMPRYIYSIVDRPVWVVGGGLTAAPDVAARTPVLSQARAPAGSTDDSPAAASGARPDALDGPRR